VHAANSHIISRIVTGLLMLLSLLRVQPPLPLPLLPLLP